MKQGLTWKNFDKILKKPAILTTNTCLIISLGDGGGSIIMIGGMALIKCRTKSLLHVVLVIKFITRGST